MKHWKEIVAEEFSFQFERSRGAGGQHVNRTESAVILRFSVPLSRAFSQEQKDLIYQKLSYRMNKFGELLVRDEQSRARAQNLEMAKEKFFAMIEQALHVPKKRISTKPTYSSKRRKLDSKKKDGEKKTSRKKVSWD